MNKYAYAFAAIAAAVCPVDLQAQGSVYQAADGLVVIEIESAADLQDWVSRTDLGDYTGSAYLHYEGSNYLGDPGNSTLAFRVQVDRAGTYRFQWRSRIAQGTSARDHNDSWLRISGGTDFYANRGGDVVWPKGSGKSPNPQGQSKDGWLKAYQNRRDTWTWDTWTSDHDARPIFVDVDGPTELLIEVSGRSTGHAIDRLVLYHADVDEATAHDLTTPESSRGDGTGGDGGDTDPDDGNEDPDGGNDNPDGGDEDPDGDDEKPGGGDDSGNPGDGTSSIIDAPKATAIQAFPNPATEQISFRVPATLVSQEQLSTTLVDALGRSYAARLEVNGDHLTLRVSDLPAGLYRLAFETTGSRYVSTFMRAN